MNSKHTSEPWRVEQYNSDIPKVTYKPVKVIADNITIHIGNGDNALPIAKRIVDCVNACEGINPDAVHNLLEALQWIAENTIHTGSREIAQDAINKATS